MKILDALARFAIYLFVTILYTLAIFINIVLSFELRYPEMMGEPIWGLLLMISAGIGIFINLSAYLVTKRLRKKQSAK